MRTVYNLLIALASPFFFLRLLYRSRETPAYRSRWNERFAVYRSPPAKCGVIWFHAVSFGEAEAVFPLILALQERYPEIPQLVTATTVTGSNRIRSVLGDSVQHVYLPYDIPGTARRFLDRFKPILGVVVETEIWPNLYRECATRQIPLTIVNARLSEKSAHGYRMLHGLFRETLSFVSLIAAQTPEDAQRFSDIGANNTVVRVTGNLKFDYRVPDNIFEVGINLRNKLFGRRPVWIAASTHHGEEEQILDAFARAQSKISNLLLILVPRRPERFDKVRLLCEDRGFNVVSRSSGLPCQDRCDIFLLDSMGELKLFYATADVAFVGGSLVKTGGHNALEAAALGIPVLFGPYMFNFAKIADSLIQAGAAFQVADPVSLARQVVALLEDPVSRKGAGTLAQTFVQANRGSLARILELLKDYLDRPESPVKSE